MLRIAINTIAVLAAAYMLNGVHVDGVGYAIIVAVVISLLNVIVRPLLIVLTIPATVLSLGLFLFVINACIILIADWIIDGFSVDGFWWALLFSLIATFVKSALNAFTKDEKKRVDETSG
ncbi:MAG: phage holin family protein [Flavobacteriales bacterium]|nr:phage holin family protein [Flavobacteriales bacterium]